MVETPFEKYVKPVTMQDLICPDCGSLYRAVCSTACPQCPGCIFVYMALMEKNW